MISYNKNQRLRRPCKRCEKIFIPTGNSNRLCVECWTKSIKRKRLLNKIEVL